MKPKAAWTVFLVVECLTLAWLYTTRDRLPPLLASHFAGDGHANGFMPRDGYLALMAAIALFIPLLLAMVTGSLSRLGPERINLPNKDYWLAPARRQATLDALQAHSLWFGTGLAGFLGAVHGLVVQANATTPPHLDAAAIGMALAGFIGWSLAWTVVLLRRFRRP